MAQRSMRDPIHKNKHCSELLNRLPLEFRDRLKLEKTASHEKVDIPPWESFIYDKLLICNNQTQSKTKNHKYL